MSTFQFTLVGQTPIILHADSIPWADRMQEWKDNPENRGQSRAGDDRTPAFRWIGSAYLDETGLCLPAENISRCLMSAGARVPVPGGRGGKTFKQQTMAGMVIVEPTMPLLSAGKIVPKSIFETLLTEKDFSIHQSTMAKYGVELFMRRAKIGASKHIRVRPRLASWSCTGTLECWDDVLEKSLPEIFKIAGAQFGLCDWRPGCSTPGPFGRFTVELKKA